MFVAVIPLFVVEEHHEAFLIWQAARHEGLIAERGNALLHVDEHIDITVPRLRRPLSTAVHDIQGAAAFTYEELSCSEFIIPALHLGIFEDFVWLGRDVAGITNQLMVVHSSALQGRSFELRRFPITNGRPTALEIDALDGYVVRYRAQDADDPLPNMQNVVLDIDLDYFSCEEAVEKPRRIEVAKAEFEAFHSDRYHFLRLSQGNRIKMIEAHGRYYLHLNDYGDAGAAPRRVDQRTILDRIGTLVNLLRRHEVAPRLIEIARSRHSGYTPWVNAHSSKKR